MHYYQHHIGDFIKDTARLSDQHAMVYLRMLWRYYDTEKPLPDDLALLAFQVGSDERVVSLILSSYFTLDGGVWRHKRCDAEIAEFHAVANKRSASAQARWKKSNANGMQMHSECIPNAQQSESECNATHNPLPNTQEPIKNTRRAARSCEVDPTFLQAWDTYPSRPGNSRADALKAWQARIKAGADPQAMLDGVRRYADYCVVAQVEPRYVKQAATFFGPGEHYLAEWKAPPEIRRKEFIPARSHESFRERDKRIAMEEYEQWTGKRHPDLERVRDEQNVIDITPMQMPMERIA